MATLELTRHFDLLVFRLGIFQMLTLSLKMSLKQESTGLTMFNKEKNVQ